jgi:hypothetical protein
MAGAGKRHNMGRPGQNPGEHQLCRGAVLGWGMPSQLLDKLKVPAQIVTLKPRHLAPCVGRAQHRELGDVTGQKTTAEGAVGD